MPPEPDTRWQYFLGGIDDHGQPVPMSFDILEGVASEWVSLLPDDISKGGPASLLRMARSLFVHSWFDYEFMAVACLMGLQATEAAFRVLYAGDDKTPFRTLVKRAHEQGILPAEVADRAHAGAALRNSFSHPEMQSALSVGMAAPVLENSHRLVALLLTAAASAKSSAPDSADAP